MQDIRVISNKGDAIEGHADHITGRKDTESEQFDTITMIPKSGPLRGRGIIK